MKTISKDDQMDGLTLEDIEFLKILANSDAALLSMGMSDEIKHRIDTRIGAILRQYYREKTMALDTYWSSEFKKAGISDDDGKAAIACARRLGLDIS